MRISLLILIFLSFSIFAECSKGTPNKLNPHPQKGSVKRLQIEGPEYEVNLEVNGRRNEFSEVAPAKSADAAKREAKYRVGINAGQLPEYVFKNTVYDASGTPVQIVQEFYLVELIPGKGKAHVILMRHEKGDHQHPHWEVGLPESDATNAMHLGTSGERKGSYLYHNQNKIRVFFKG